MTTNKAYSVLAKYYDELMTDFDYELMYKFIKDNLQGNNILDLGCGSGTISIKLANEKFNVTAIDSSIEMLNVALKKARDKNLDILFLNQDVTNLDLNSKYDTITAICDIFNYLDSDSLKKTCNTVYKHLEKGGKFIFDISSKYKLSQILGDNLYFEDLEDITYFWQNEHDKNKKCINMDLIFFELLENGNYERFEEFQTQYYHTQDEIKNYLKKFSKIEFFNEDLKEFTDKSQRLVVVATK